MKKLLINTLLILISASAYAQITVNPNANATNLAERLVGNGINISNATLNCPALASGDFTVTSSNLNLDSGIVLTTGTAASDPGNFVDGMNGPFGISATDNNAPGDVDLTALSNQQTFDACILEFDFETTGDSVSFNYVFGSAEYQTFTCSQYNDVFGFFLSGPGIAGTFTNGAINIATVPGSANACPVGVSTIYCPDTSTNTTTSCCNATTSCHATTTGCGVFTTPTATCPYFVCNNGGTTVTYPGFTTVLTAGAQIMPCTTYHFKLAIADAADGTLDSGVMLEAGSFNAKEVGLDLNAGLLTLGGNPLLIEGCDSLSIDIKFKKFGIPTSDTVRFTIQGTALNNVDYNAIPSYLVFSANPADTLRTITIGALNDGIPEGTETIIIYLQNFCSTALLDTIVIEVIDSLGADFFITNNAGNDFKDSICLGYEFSYAPFTSPINGIGPLRYDWDMGDGTQRLNAGNGIQQIIYQQPGIYTVTLAVTDTRGCSDTARHDVLVDFPPYVELSASPTEICVGEKVYFKDSVAPGTLNVIYDFGDGTVLNGLHNPNYNYDLPGTFDVTLTGEYLICPDAVATIPIQVNAFPIINLGEDRTICPGLTETIKLSNLENNAQILNWSTGVNTSSITVEEPGRYWASADNKGCSTTDSIWIKRDCYLNIPNSFSPNGDGNNDYFLPRDLLSAGLVAFDMKILNRWGEVIFATNSINGRGWDGKYGNKEQAVGVYVYQISAQWKNGFSNTFTGNLTLLR